MSHVFGRFILMQANIFLVRNFTDLLLKGVSFGMLLSGTGF